MARQLWYWQDWVEVPRQSINPDGVLEDLLEGTKCERTRYTWWMVGYKWWKLFFLNPAPRMVFVKDPRLLIDRKKSQIFTKQGEVMKWLRENVHSPITVCIDTSEARNGQWDTNQEDFAWVEFTDPQEAVMFKLVFG